MMAGALTPTEGHIEVDGGRVAADSVAQMRALGVRAVFQEFSLVPDLSVADNIALGEEAVGALGLLDKRGMRQRAQALIHELGFELDAKAKVGDLPRGKQQMVEICKAVLESPSVLILDEPTASLSDQDSAALFRLVERLKSQGAAIVYITHRMHEIPLIGDVVTVLRDGQHVDTVAADTPEDRLIELMTGRKVSDVYPKIEGKPGEVLLALRGVSSADGHVVDVDLEVRAGEIVGLAGLVGCGKSHVGQLCFGLGRVKSGDIRLAGKTVSFGHPADAIAQGVWYSPSDRKRDGLALMRSAFENMVLSSLQFGRKRSWLRRPSEEKELVRQLAEQVEFAQARAGEAVSNFSGGNQQKVLLAKGLAQDVQVYIFDEPTVGVDIGARESIYRYFGELCASGAAVLLISSDLSELMGLSHRLLVMRNGRTVAHYTHEQFEQHTILEQFFD